MASDINRVILVGRLTRDPEFKTASTGTSYCRFTLASNRSFFRKDTNKNEDEAGFFDCVAWGKLAEIISQYATKGKRIGVDGSLRFNIWEDSEGKRQSKVNIYVENFQFLEPAKQGADYGSSSTEAGSHPSENFSRPAHEDAGRSSANENAFDGEDIPF